MRRQEGRERQTQQPAGGTGRSGVGESPGSRPSSCSRELQRGQPWRPRAHLRQAAARPLNARVMYFVLRGQPWRPCAYLSQAATCPLNARVICISYLHGHYTTALKMALYIFKMARADLCLSFKRWPRGRRGACAVNN